MVRGRLGHGQRGERRRVRERLVVGLGHPREERGHVGLGHQHVVVGLEPTRHHLGVGPLVEVVLLEAHRVRLRLEAERGHLRHDDGGVEPAAQEHPQRHLALQAPFDRPADPLAHLRAHARHVGALLAHERRGRRPVAVTLDVSVTPAHPVARRDLLHPRPRRALGRHVLQHQVLGHGLGVQVGRGGQERQHGVEGRAEGDRVARGRRVERLLAEAVAREEDLALVQVHDGEREHPAQALHHGRAVRRVERGEDLGVAGGPHRVSAPHEVRAQLVMVVDLAVEGHDVAAVGRDHRLRSVRAVDDRQPCVREPDPALGPHVQLVGPAVADRLQRALERVAIGGAGAQDAREAAHQSILRPRGKRSPASTRR